MRLRTRVAVGLALIALTAAACGDDDDSSTDADSDSGATETTASASDEPFTIGFAIGKTGAYEPFDVPALRAAELAIDRINADGGLLGRQLEVVSADNQSDPAQSANAGLQVIEDGADMVVVSCDYDLGGPAAVEAQKEGLMSWSTCAGSTLFGPAGVGPNAFTQGVPGILEGAAGAEWATGEGHKTAFVMRDGDFSYTDELCTGFVDRFTEINGDDAIVGEEAVKSFDQQSFAAQTSAVRSASPDLVYVCMIGGPGETQLLKELRSAGIDTTIMGGQSLDGTYWHDAVPDLSNTYFTTHASIFGDDPSSTINDLLADYEEEYGERIPTSHGITGYLIIEAWAAAVEEAGSFDAGAVTEALESFDGFESALGSMTFTAELHINFDRELRVMQIDGGDTTYLTTQVVEDPPQVG